MSFDFLYIKVYCNYFWQLKLKIDLLWIIKPSIIGLSGSKEINFY